MITDATTQLARKASRPRATQSAAERADVTRHAVICAAVLVAAPLAITFVAFLIWLPLVPAARVDGEPLQGVVSIAVAVGACVGLTLGRLLPAPRRAHLGARLVAVASLAGSGLLGLAFASRPLEIAAVAAIVGAADGYVVSLAWSEIRLRVPPADRGISLGAAAGSFGAVVGVGLVASPWVQREPEVALAAASVVVISVLAATATRPWLRRLGRVPKATTGSNPVAEGRGDSRRGGPDRVRPEC